jgi:hypothetical protein
LPHPRPSILPLLPFSFPALDGKNVTATFNVGKLTSNGGDLCSQPTISRWENTPDLRQVVALPRMLVDVHCASYPTPSAHVTLDIDNTADAVHGHQLLTFFNAFENTHYTLPILVYDTATARPVAMILRSGLSASSSAVPHPDRRPGPHPVNRTSGG